MAGSCAGLLEAGMENGRVSGCEPILSLATYSYDRLPPNQHNKRSCLVLNILVHNSSVCAASAVSALPCAAQAEHANRPPCPPSTVLCWLSIIPRERAQPLHDGILIVFVRLGHQRILVERATAAAACNVQLTSESGGSRPSAAMPAVAGLLHYRQSSLNMSLTLESWLRSMSG